MNAFKVDKIKYDSSIFWRGSTVYLDENNRYVITSDAWT